MSLKWQGIVVLVDLAVALGVMGFEKGPADFVMFMSVVVLVPLGIITPADVLAGLANSGLATVMILFVIAFAIEKTGGLDVIVKILKLGMKPEGGESLSSLILFYFKLGVPIGLLSAFLNNTPIVAMFIPVLADFAKVAGMSPSKLMIPLSYFTILGGTITKIGTSTNLVVYSLANRSMPEQINDDTFGLFALAIVGVPTFLAGVLYVTLLGPTKMLPKRIAPSITIESTREYIVTTVIPKGHPLIGQTLVKLRHLKELFLVQIVRNYEDGSPAKILPAPPSTEILREGDTLYFAGSAEKFVLLREHGLVVKEGAERDVDLNRLGEENVIYEAVISPHSSYISHSVSVKELEFRTKFGAAIIAVHRQGERINEPIGEIKLQAHDIVLLIGGHEFEEKHFHDHNNFSVVRRLNQVPPRRKLWQAVIAALALLVPIILSNLDIPVVGNQGTLDFNTCLWLGACVVLIAGCITPREARQSLSWEVYILIAMSFALGTAMQKSGAAQWIANGLTSITRNSAGLLVATYFVTVVLNSILTNNAAVAVVWPIIDSAIRTTGYDPIPFVLALCMAGSADFATPIGYQTNLMVWSPGGYRFYDYIVFGGPLQLLVAAVTIPICIWTTSWIIWTAVLGVLNVVLFVVVVALNFDSVGRRLGLKKRERTLEEGLGSETPITPTAAVELPVDDSVEKDEIGLQKAASIDSGSRYEAERYDGAGISFRATGDT
ncbi:citrate transporter-domain-containing protein [Hyaloraphidium curvatum]|nr:citrate transporter-domain-containing protein [Hyaloraphidium curvatum]